MLTFLLSVLLYQGQFGNELLVIAAHSTLDSFIGKKTIQRGLCRAGVRIAEYLCKDLGNKLLWKLSEALDELVRAALLQDARLSWTDKARAEIAAAKGTASANPSEGTASPDPSQGGENGGGGTGNSGNSGGSTGGNTGGDNGGDDNGGDDNGGGDGPIGDAE